MKLKHLIILMLFAIGVAMPLKAQDPFVYAGLGFSKQALSLRLGYNPELFGGEIHIKSDRNRLFKDIAGMDGRRHRFSLMGGANLNVYNLLVLTANAGYGSAGTYLSSALGDSYGVDPADFHRGFEAGVALDIAIGHLSVFGGWSRIFDSRPGVFSEWTFGIGLLL